MSIAAAAIFMVRLLLLLAVILTDSDYSFPALSVLTQAGDGITAVFLVWAVMPHPPHLPRLGDTLMLIGLFLILIMSVYLTQLGGMESVWTIFNLLVYGTGFIFLLTNRDTRASLRTTLLFVLLVAAAVGWLRLGYFIAFPLWAVLLYHESNRPVVSYGGDVHENLTALLTLSTAVIRPTEEENILQHAIHLVAELTHADFIGIASRNAEQPNTLYVMSNQPQSRKNEPSSWTLNVSDWPAFRQVLEKQHAVRLALSGRGARQVTAWYREMGLPVMGDLSIFPITAGEEKHALLLLAGQAAEGVADEKNEQLIEAMAAYIAAALDSAKRAATAVPPPAPSEQEMIASEDVIALKQERDDLQAYNKMLADKLKQTEQRLSGGTKRIKQLTEAMTVLKKRKRNARAIELEDEVAALQEALLTAEEALAMVAASEAEISMDWVMMTITRYSGQLEEAQMQIQSLQNELLSWERSAGNEAVLMSIRELRAPITAVTGYTDLLLKEQAGALTAEQREFLAHIQTNTERMGELLAQIVQISADSRQMAETSYGVLTVEELVETAVDTVMPHIRQKQLQFGYTITPELPSLPVTYHILISVLSGLLEYSCQQSPPKGQVAFVADIYEIEENDDMLTYLGLTIHINKSKIVSADIPRLFDEQGSTPQLRMFRSLVETKGGRLWVDSGEGDGLEFSILLPI